MSLCQVDLLQMCRGKLAEEALRRDPQLCIIVGHSNLLETLVTSLTNSTDIFRAKRNAKCSGPSRLEKAKKEKRTH